METHLKSCVISRRDERKQTRRIFSYPVKRLYTEALRPVKWLNEAPLWQREEGDPDSRGAGGWTATGDTARSRGMRHERAGTANPFNSSRTLRAGSCIYVFANVTTPCKCFTRY